MTILLPALVTFALATPAEPADLPEELLARVEAKMAEVDTLKAKVTHVTIQGLLGDEQRRFGTLAYDDPDPDAAGGGAAKFAIHFDREAVNDQLRPRERSYVFDGRWLAERLPDDRVFIRRELVAADDTRDPLEFGEGPFALPLNLQRDRLARRFEIAAIDEADTDVPGALGLRLTRKEGVDVEQARIDLWFDAESLLPVKVDALEDDETRQVIYLREPELNPTLEPQTFDTTAPAGGGWRVEEHRLQP